MPLDAATEFAKAKSRLRGKQVQFCDEYLFGDNSGNIAACARKVGYGESTVKCDAHKWVPKHGDDRVLTLSREEQGEHLRDVTIALLWGMKLKAEEARKVVVAKSEQRAKLNITKDRVLRSLLEVAERCAGYTVDAATGERAGEFQEKNFKPGTAQRGFELIGKDMGMFFDRGDAAKPKTVDEMSPEELDQHIASTLERIDALAGARPAGKAKAKKH